MGGDLLAAASSNLQEPKAEAATLDPGNVASAIPIAPPSPLGAPMVPPLHRMPKIAGEVRQEFQELADLAQHFPEGPLRNAYNKLMEAIEPVYERTALNLEFRENLITEGQDAITETFSRFRAETIGLLEKLVADASRGSSGFMQWISDGIEKITKLASVVENKIPEMNGKPDTTPVDTSGVNTGNSTPPLDERPVVGMDGKPIPQTNEDLTLETTGGVPIEPAHASDYVLQIASKPTLRYLLDSMAKIPDIKRNADQIGLSSKNLQNAEEYILDMTKSETQKIQFLANMGILVPHYGGVAQATLRYLKNPPSSEVSLGDFLKGDMVANFSQYGQHLRGNMDLSVLDLSGMYMPNGADLSGTNFTATDLSGAKLPGANLVGSNLTQADLSGAYLASAQLIGVFAHGADFKYANLANANLSYGDFTGSRFSDVNTTVSNFSHSNLTRTDWRPLDSNNAEYMNFGANFTGATSSGMIRPDLRPNYPF